MSASPSRFLVLITAALLGTALPTLASDPPAEVPYPEGFRHWAHVKSMVIGAGHPLADPFAGMHHIYANPAALEGYRTGRFPDGAVIVFDLLDVSEADDALVEAGRKLVGVMHRDSKRFAETGGWGFEGFAGDSRSQRLVSDAGAGCFACHLAQEQTGYVFSAWRE